MGALLLLPPSDGANEDQLPGVPEAESAGIRDAVQAASEGAQLAEGAVVYAESEGSSEDEPDEEDDDDVPPEDRLPAADLAAIEALDAEDDLLFEADIEGILEAVGMQGPLLALMQNVALMDLLISVLLGVAIWLPLMIGKTIAATNALRLVLLPISIVRLVTDPIADLIISATNQAKKSILPIRQEPPKHGLALRIKALVQAVMSRLAGREPPPAARQTLSAYLKIRFEAYRDLTRVASLKVAEAIQTRWYLMASQDTELDRVLCIALGYAVVLAGAAFYLRHSQNQQARNGMRAVRDAVKQQFVLFKAAFFFIVEIVLFPTMCGILLNLATLPLIPGVSVQSRIAYHIRAPISSGFLTWLAGTNFMYAFATWISMVRKCIRKGVLWFIRDPSDPQTNPLREILETPAFNQAKKITRSLLVYGSIVLSCFGIFPWLSRLVTLGVFPLRWDMSRPISTVPIDLLCALIVIPFTLGHARAKRFVRKSLSEWCVLTSHQLRLSSFMLDVRRSDEEGSHVRRTWRAWLLCKKAPIPPLAEHDGSTCSTTSDVIFRKDGGFARVVAADNVKIVSKSMFVRVHEDGSALDGEGAALIQNQLTKGPNDESKFQVVYIPPHFKTRIILFVYLLWMTGSLAIFTFLTVPLLTGRAILDLLLSQPAHDMYSMLVGLHVVLATSWLYKILMRKWRYFRRRRRPFQRTAFRETFNPQTLRQAAKTAGHLLGLALNLTLLLPLLLGLTVHFYVLSPIELRLRGRPSVSLGMDWAYGALYCSLVLSISRMMRLNNSLSATLASIRSEDLLTAAPALNVRLTALNLKLALALFLPATVSVTLPLVISFCWRQFRIEGGPPTLESAAVFQEVVYILSGSTAANWLLPPANKLAARWMGRVWEKEYLIQRKLRNIDDPVLETEELAANIPLPPSP